MALTVYVTVTTDRPLLTSFNHNKGINHWKMKRIDTKKQTPVITGGGHRKQKVVSALYLHKPAYFLVH